MPSKRYIGKPCAYCCYVISKTADHVIAREFFLEEDRANLPKVPACERCNQEKSALENYAMTTFVAASKHVESGRYRRNQVRPRLAKNAKLQRELGINNPPIWRESNGILQPMYRLTVEAEKLKNLMALIAKGLFYHHFGTPLSQDFYADAAMFHPEHEAALWLQYQPLFPANSFAAQASFGRDTFTYEMVQSAGRRSLTLWRMRWYGGISLHGQGAPQQGASWWWVVTRPTKDAVKRETTANSLS